MRRQLPRIMLAFIAVGLITLAAICWSPLQRIYAMSAL